MGRLFVFTKIISYNNVGQRQVKAIALLYTITWTNEKLNFFLYISY